MSRHIYWNVELQTREETIEIKEILKESPGDPSNPPLFSRLEIIDQKGSNQVFSCTEEERERIRNGAKVILTIKESIVSARVTL